MAYDLYSKKRWLGGLATISGYDSKISAVAKYNKTREGRGKTPALNDFFEKGETTDVQAVIEDVSKVLNWKGGGLAEETVTIFKNFRKLLRKAREHAWVGDEVN